jgi:hypothetical protein
MMAMLPHALDAKSAWTHRAMAPAACLGDRGADTLLRDPEGEKGGEVRPMQIAAIRERAWALFSVMCGP